MPSASRRAATSVTISGLPHTKQLVWTPSSSIAAASPSCIYPLRNPSGSGSCFERYGRY